MPQPVAAPLTFRSLDATHYSSGGLGWACAVTTGGDAYCFSAEGER